MSPLGPTEALTQAVKTKRHLNPILQYSREDWAKVHKQSHISQYTQMYSTVWNKPSIRIRKESFCMEFLVENNQ